MLLTAACALALSLFCHLGLPGTSLPIAAELLAGACLVGWVMLGSRACAVLLPAAWALWSAGGIVSDRLNPALAGRDVLLEGTVCSVPVRSGRAVRFTVRTPASQPGDALPRRVYLGWYSAASAPKPGETWRLKVRLRRPRGTLNPGAFDFERWAFERGIGATGYVRTSALNRRLSLRGGCELTALRYRTAEQIVRVLDGRPMSAYLSALAVGVRQGLTPADWDLLRDSGTVHLLAISGLHIGLVAGFGLLIGRQSARWLVLVGVQCSPYFVSRAIALAAATVYAALAGFSIPTLRALVMLVVVLGLSCMRRHWSGLSVLGAALYVVILVDPAAPVSMGFWLSFVAVAALLVGGQGQLPRANRPSRGIRRSLHRLLAAQAAIAIGLGPLGVLFFNRVSWIAPLVNLLVIPIFAAIVVPLVLIGTLLLMAGVDLGVRVLSLAEYVLTAVMTGVHSLLERIDPVWHVSGIAPALLAIVGGGALLAIWPRPCPGRVAICAALLALLVAGPRLREPDGLTVTVMDVGQGLAVMLRTSGYTLLYDAGPAYGNRDAGATVVLPVMRHAGAHRLDQIVLSHLDADHSGGLNSVLAEFPADLMAPEPLPGDQFQFVSVSRCASPLSWSRRGIVFTILSPPIVTRQARASRNDRSCVLLVEFGDFRVLLPGDIEIGAETNLVSSGLLGPVDVVIAPHHGSRTSSSAAFVRALEPGLVIYSTGHGNRWQFPDREVVARWQSVSDCQLSTAASGAITIEIGKQDAAPVLREFRADAARIWTEPGVADLPCNAERDATG